MLSQPAIYQRLANGFIALRLDWEQGNHFKERFGFIPGTGDQLLLDPDGKLIPPPKAGAKVYGRHGCDITADILDALAATNANTLRMDWFWWPSNASRRIGGRYPVAHTAIAGYARLPLAFVEGPIPGALNHPDFLQWHIRQFIWVRGETNAKSRIRIERVKDGLKPGLPKTLALIDPAAMSTLALGHELDRAWLTYMAERPFVARGYLENPHGGWMRSVKDQMISEETEIRRRAVAGDLLPPGRKAKERAPY